MDEKQREQFKEALDKKNAEAAERAHDSVAAPEQQQSDTDESEDVPSARDKSSRHGKVTADKWNQ